MRPDEIHAHVYVKPRFGQFIGVVRANGHETESRPLPTREAAQQEAAAMLRRLGSCHARQEVKRP
jgi:hypothetical protein